MRLGLPIYGSTRRFDPSGAYACQMVRLLNEPLVDFSVRHARVFIAGELKRVMLFRFLAWFHALPMRRGELVIPVEAPLGNPKLKFPYRVMEEVL